MNENQGGTSYCYVLDWHVKNVGDFIIRLERLLLSRPEWSNGTYVLTRKQRKDKKTTTTSNSKSSSSSSSSRGTEAAAEELRQQQSN